MPKSDNPNSQNDKNRIHFDGITHDEMIAEIARINALIHDEMDKLWGCANVRIDPISTTLKKEKE